MEGSSLVPDIYIDRGHQMCLFYGMCKFNRYDQQTKNWSTTIQGPLRIFRNSKTNIIKVNIQDLEKNDISSFKIKKDAVLKEIAGNPRAHSLEVNED